MLEYIVICLFAFIGSGLTFFSGFGLGTLLLPVFALFFPVEAAIALTAIVHFLNNVFKLTLVGRGINIPVILRFGIPAILFAILGAYVLTFLSDMAPLFSYTAFNREFYIMPVKLTIAVLLFVFALFDIIPALTRLNFNQKYLPLGGALSGFFGGLSGNQGALRTAFLIRANLSKESFIATGVAIAILIDISRLTVYFGEILNFGNQFDYLLVTAATLSAFTGAFLGNMLLKKITIKTLQIIVGIMLLVFSLLLGSGII